MEITRQAGALGAIVTGVDLASVDDVTYKELRDALLEHLVICVRDQAHVTPDEQVAFSARWGRIEPHPYVPPIEGHPGDHAGVRPEPDHGHVARRLHVREAAAVDQLAARARDPAYGGDTMFSNGYLAYEGLSPGLRETLDGLRAVHYATQLAIDSGMPDDEIVNSHPVVCTHPETGKRALFVNGNYTRHFDGWSIDDSHRCSTTCTHSSPASSTPGATVGSRVTCSSGTTGACSTRSSATPPARNARCTAPRSQEARHDDRHPLDRQPRRPRRRATRPLVQPAPREVPRRRPAHRDGAAGDPMLDGGGYIEAPGTEGDPVAWWFYEDQRYSVKRLIAAAGYPRRGDRLRRHHLRPDAPRLLAAEGPPRRHDDEPRRGVARASRTTRASAARSSSRQGQGARPALRRGVQRLDGRRVVRGQQRAPDPALPGAAVGRRARRRRGAAQRRARRARRSRSPSCPPWLGPAEHPLRLLGAVLRRVRGDRHGGRHAHRLGDEDGQRRPTDAPDAVQAVDMFANSAVSLIDFLFSGVLVRFPDLKLLYAEAQIGWIPYVLERVDDVWDIHRGLERQPAQRHEPPSQYYYRQVVSCFFKDSVGVENLDRVGVDNIAFETDYPHQDGTWPNTEQVAKELFGHSTPTRSTRSCAATRSASSASRASATAAVRSRRDHPRSGGDDRRHRGGPARPPRTAARRARRAKLPGRARRRQPGRSRSPRRRLARLPPHGALRRSGARRAHPARDRGDHARRPRLHRPPRRRAGVRADRRRRRRRSRGRARPCARAPPP